MQTCTHKQKLIYAAVKTFVFFYKFCSSIVIRYFCYCNVVSARITTEIHPPPNLGVEDMKEDNSRPNWVQDGGRPQSNPFVAI